MSQFEIASESIAYKRYLTVYQRDVKSPHASGKDDDVFSYDIVGHPRCSFKYSVVFPFHSATNPTKEPTVTLIREYCQGPNQMCYSLPTGGFDAAKHSGSMEECARQEMSEEAHLTRGKFIRLISEDHEGLWEVKWCRNRFTPFLCLDPEVDPDPQPRDEEERIEVLRVSISELRSILRSGEMMLPSMTTCYLTLEELTKRGLI